MKMSGCADNLDFIKESLCQAMNAMATLRLQGFEILRLAETDGSSRPTIIVRYNTQCRKVQRDGRAVCYVSGNDRRGRFRKWQMQVNKCRVVWEEI